MGKREQIALQIRTMRKSRRMTQKDLAHAIGQSPSSITMYENGSREPSFETLEALADVFNVPLESLLGYEYHGTDPDDYFTQLDKPKNNDVRLLIRGLNQLSPEEIEQATNVMKAMFTKYADYFDKENYDDIT